MTSHLHNNASNEIVGNQQLKKGNENATNFAGADRARALEAVRRRKQNAVIRFRMLRKQSRKHIDNSDTQLKHAELGHGVGWRRRSDATHVIATNGALKLEQRRCTTKNKQTVVKTSKRDDK